MVPIGLEQGFNAAYLSKHAYDHNVNLQHSRDFNVLSWFLYCEVRGHWCVSEKE